MKKYYNKLVRDKIPEIIEIAGKRAEIRIADDSEYANLLKQKLLEEVDEYMQSNNPDELADIIEVVIWDFCIIPKAENIGVLVAQKKDFTPHFVELISD